VIHSNSELRLVNPTIGFGLFATRFIPKGTITWVCDPLDQVIPAETAAKFSPLTKQLLEKYSYLNGKGDRVLCWDHARYVNHSCDPTCLAAGFDFEIAVRDIFPGDEITDDYGTLNLEEDMTCHCGDPHCRGVLRPDDFLTYGERWDEIVAEAFSHLRNVEQPLWELVQEKELVAQVLAGAMPIPSCLVHRFDSGERSAVGAGS
jgi:hypothetical protein